MQVASRATDRFAHRRKTRNVSVQKHEIATPRFLIPENGVFARIAAPRASQPTVRGLRDAIFSPTMHSPDNAMHSDSIRIHDNTKRLRSIGQSPQRTGHHVHSES
ncbi:hypothetical protein KDW49_24615 [Burkholderia dolosa]|uniref:hypothetical protein n=1 Tax=Burkholderia dolosa TaxID=152500 RepID=UPI001B907E3A|nr:hypothetical protein [Burkholderia dolosa]MBR8303898.1 hypothetical protein [Burkholderia dolosa]